LSTIESPIPPINEGEALGKTIVAVFGTIDNYVLKGLIPTKPGVTAGSIGLVRVIEVGINSSFKVGYKYVNYPYCNQRLYGSDIDGFLSEYSVVSQQCTLELTQELGGINGLALHYLYLSNVGEYVRSTSAFNVCVIGDGLDLIINSTYLSNLGCEVTAVLCKDEHRVIDFLASKCYRVIKMRNLRGNEVFDAIILTGGSTTSPYILSLVKVNGSLIVSPTYAPLFNMYILQPHKITVYVPGFSNKVNEVLGVINEIPNNILMSKLAIVKELDDVLPLIGNFEKVIVELGY